MSIWKIIRVITGEAAAELREQGYDQNPGMDARYKPGMIEVAANMIGCNVSANDHRGRQKVIRVKYPEGWYEQAELEREARRKRDEQNADTESVSARVPGGFEVPNDQPDRDGGRVRRRWLRNRGLHENQ